MSVFIRIKLVVTLLFLILFGFLTLPNLSLADLSYEIPYTIGPNNGDVYCDRLPYQESIHFQSYQIARDSLENVLFQSTTIGNGACTGSLQASRNSPGNFSAGSVNSNLVDGSPGIYYIVLYLQNNFTQPYGYMAFDCIEAGVCESLRLTPYTSSRQQLFANISPEGIIDSSTFPNEGCSHNVKGSNIFATMYTLYYGSYPDQSTPNHLDNPNYVDSCRDLFLNYSLENTGHTSLGDGNYWLSLGANSTGETATNWNYYFLAKRENGTWSAPTEGTCTDGIQNQDETGVDTGGVCEQSKKPVLIVPGVLGTDILKDGEKLWLDLARNFTDIGDEFMDPLQFNINLTPLDASLTIGGLIMNPLPTFHFYDRIVEELENQGYTQGASQDDNLFLFPYDWRYGISENNVNQLEQKIEDIRTQTGSEKVDIIAHSAGGLLVKKYAVENPNEHYINKAVFVGVPNTGAPQAVKNLLQGSNFGVPRLADSEMKKIAENMPMAYDLLPSEQYFNVKGSYIKVIGPELFNFRDLNFSESQDFLADDHDLNLQAISNAQNLHSSDFDNFDLRTLDIDLYSINGCKGGTLTKVIERRTLDNLGNIITTYDKPDRSPGDNTVPLESSTNLPINSSNKYYALKADHSKMLSQDGIRQQVVNIISGSNLSLDDDLISQDISECKLNGEAISVFSPVDISVVDQDGNIAELVFGGIQNDIPNASFDIFGDHKFIYLPTDEGQEYNISLKGTGSGAFTITSEDISENQTIRTETFADIPVTTDLKGSLNIQGSNTALLLDANGDNINDFTLIGKPGEIVSMPYVFSGFLQPIDYTAHQTGQDLSVFKAGSTVPVKFQLKKQDGTIVQAKTPPTWLTPQKGSKMNFPIDESIYSLPANSGNEFRWDSISQQYIYNWGTKGLMPGYWYKIGVKLDDGNTYYVTVGLK